MAYWNTKRFKGWKITKKVGNLSWFGFLWTVLWLFISQLSFALYRFWNYFSPNKEVELTNSLVPCTVIGENLNLIYLWSLFSQIHLHKYLHDLSFSDVIAPDDTVTGQGKGGRGRGKCCYPVKSVQELIWAHYCQIKSEDCQCSFAIINTKHNIISCVFQMRMVKDIYIFLW